MTGSFFPTLVSIVVLVGILYLAYLASKFLGTSAIRRSSSKSIKLLDIVSLGQDKAIAAIKVGEKQLLVGISQGGITKLMDLEEGDIAEMQLEEEAIDMEHRFKDMLSKLKKG